MNDGIIAVRPPTHNELLVIERLAADLERAASVDEIKDIRDRAMAVQLYTRKRFGGLAASQAAGRVVTDATLRLAAMYREEQSAQGDGCGGAGGGRRSTLDRDQDSRPGKAAIAQAAGMDPAALSRLRAVLEAPPQVIEEAKVAIEARGDIATPTAVLKQITSASSQVDYDGDSSFTPDRIVAKVRAALGTIDVDPATHAVAQRTVRAATFYTKDDDGLTKPWTGTVFCNPPYSSGPQGVEGFTKKLIEEYESGRTTAAVFLVNNSTDASWFQSLLAFGLPVCLTRGRLPFVNVQGQEFAARRGQAIFYLGPKPDAFVNAFADIGQIVRGQIHAD